MIAIELRLLEAIDKNNYRTQRDLAKKLGISLGKLNFCLKALIQKSYVKIGIFSQNPNKLRHSYKLTFKGFSKKIRLTRAFLIRKQVEYDEFQAEIGYYQDILNQIHPQ